MNVAGALGTGKARPPSSQRRKVGAKGSAAGGRKGDGGRVIKRRLAARYAAPPSTDTFNAMAGREGSNRHPRGGSAAQAPASSQHAGVQFARLLIARFANAGDSGKVMGGVPRRTGNFGVRAVKRGRHVVGHGGFPSRFLGEMIALFVNVEIRQKLRGHVSFGGVASKLDNG
jgi:hypothetical protein